MNYVKKENYYFKKGSNMDQWMLSLLESTLPLESEKLKEPISALLGDSQILFIDFIQGLLI